MLGDEIEIRNRHLRPQKRREVFNCRCQRCDLPTDRLLRRPLLERVFRAKLPCTNLLKGLIAESEQAGVPIRLQVLRTNTKASRLYERLGFTKTGEDQMYIQMERCHLHIPTKEGSLPT